MRIRKFTSTILLSSTFLSVQVIAQYSSSIPKESAKPVSQGRTSSAGGFDELNRLGRKLATPDQDIDLLRARLQDWASLSVFAVDNRIKRSSATAQRRVVFLGDSITRNWGRSDYSDLFAAKDRGFEAVNRGIGGQTSVQMLVRFRADVINLKPETVVILAGTNDLKLLPSGDVVQRIQDNFDDMFELAKAHHIAVVVCSLLPVNDLHGLRTDTRPPETILALNAWLRTQSVRLKFQYVDLYSLLQDGHDRLRSELTADGLHPNRAGYALMTPAVLKAIDAQSKLSLRNPSKER